jgi:hypothetical protein
LLIDVLTSKLTKSEAGAETGAASAPAKAA